MKNIILDFYKKNMDSNAMFDEGRKQVLDTLIMDRKTGMHLLDINPLANSKDEKNNSLFFPSIIYIFLYPLKDGVLEDYSFIDYIPIVMCIKLDKNSMTGINLNFLTPEKRAYFLNSLWNTNSDFYYDSIYTDKRDEIINKKLAEALVNNLDDFIKYENDYLNMDLRKAFRTYSLSGIKNSRFVGYYLWQYIPFVQVKESVKGGTTLEKIQQRVCKLNDIKQKE